PGSSPVPYTTLLRSPGKGVCGVGSHSADGVRAVPGSGGSVDVLEEAALGPGDLGELDDGAGMELGEEVDEAPALADPAGLADLRSEEHTSELQSREN